MEDCLKLVKPLKRCQNVIDVTVKDNIFEAKRYTVYPDLPSTVDNIFTIETYFLNQLDAFLARKAKEGYEQQTPNTSQNTSTEKVQACA